MYRRAAIRDAVVARVTGLATTGANVFVETVIPEQLAMLPSLVVRTGADALIDDEQIPGPSSGPWRQTRALEIEIEARAAGNNLPATIDQIHLEVEQAMNVDKTLGGEADFVTWNGSPAMELSEEIEKVIAMRALGFMVHYRVDAKDPQDLED